MQAWMLLASLLASPAHALDLAVSVPIQGQDVVVTVRNGRPQARLQLYRSSTPPTVGPVPCVNPAAGICPDLQDARLVAQGVTDANGRARFTFTVPVDAPIGDVWFQAVEQGAPTSNSNRVARRVVRVCQGNETITSEEELLPWQDCGWIVGDLQVIGYEGTSLPLPHLVKVTGVFIISGANELTNLDGLASLEHASSLYLDHMPALVDIRGLSNLREVPWDLSLDALPSLTSLHGLEGIRRADIVSFYQLNITSFEGLENLERVEYELGFSAMAALTSTEALRSLRHIGESLWVTNNPMLTTLTSALPLEHVGSAYIHENAALVDISLLRGITRLPFEPGLSLERCDQLSDLGALSSLREATSVTLQHLPNLKTLHGLEQLRYVDNELYVQDNAALVDVTALSETRVDRSSDVDVSGNVSLCNDQIKALAAYQQTRIGAAGNFGECPP